MPRRRMRTWIPFGALAIFVAVIVGWPVARVLARIFTARSTSALPVTFWPGLFFESLGWAALIAALATALGWPMAWTLRRWGWRAAPLIAAPMLLPPYLAYSGWNLLRAPDSWLGSLIERAAAHGHRWVPITTGRTLAILGLTIWAAPLAAMVIAITLRRLDDDLLDQLRLDAGRRAGPHRARIALPGLLTSILFISLLMLGSAVPLHLAQIPTWSIQLWAGLDLVPPAEHWRLWARAWPLAFTAIAGVVVLGRIMRPGTGWARPSRMGPTPPRAVLMAVTLPALGVVIPLLLFAAHLRSPRSLVTFWRVSGPAVVDGLVVAAAVGAVSMAVVVMTWAALTARPPGRSGSAGTPGLVMALAVAALLPGVLVGSAIAGAWDGLGPVRDSPAILVLAHLARFAAVPALAGVWLYGSESREDRDLRAVDGSATVAGWARACWPVHSGVVIGAGLAAAILSFFEIESSVVVQPAYVENLSRQILGYLHFARTDEMSAAAVTLLTAGLAAAAAAGWLFRRAGDR
ncbi:MAG: hypothetical protein IT436_11880 [Phycisphaerales bacterium]|nr:hypothetical protein [Phycisphaerales bacterium]